ncbi:MAG: hypothetical protein ACR2GQ_02935 [Gemmatimonadota bacterium]|jgi:hypothetical protein
MLPHQSRCPGPRRIKTTVVSQGDASNYTSNILVKLRMNANGEPIVDETEASGIECS